jgi:hypothetical protein
LSTKKEYFLKNVFRTGNIKKPLFGGGVERER